MNPPTDVKISDGLLEHSLALAFDLPEQGADGFEVEWYADAGLTRRLGTVMIVRSPYAINGLAPMTRVFARARALQGGQSGPWSPLVSRIVSG